MHSDPPVESPTYADLRVAALDRWSEGLPMPGGTEASELVYDATQVLSLIATSLLVRGDRGGPPSSGATIAGAALADGLDGVRTLLGKLEDSTIPRADRNSAEDLVRRFLRESRRQLSTLALPAPDRLDRQLADLLEPLVEAIGLLSGTVVHGGWWIDDGGTEVSDASSTLRERLNAVDWLNTLERNRVFERIDGIAAETDQVEAIESLILLVDAIDALHGQPTGRARAVLLGRRFDALVLHHDTGLPAAPSLIELARVVDRMAEVRAVELPDALPRPARRIHAALRRTYDQAERDIVGQLTDLVASSSPRTDPSLVALIVAQAEPLDRLRILTASAGWSDEVRSIDSGIATQFDRRLAVLHRDLAADASAVEAIGSLLELQDAMELIRPWSSQRSLRDPDADREVLLAGTAVTLSEDIDRLKRQLVRELVKEESVDDVVSALRLRRRLLDQIDRVVAIRWNDAAQRGIDGWSGWYGDPGFAERVRNRLSTRLRIASTALQQDESSVAHRQLDRAERDLQLLELLAMVAASRPSGASSGTSASAVVGRLAIPPGSGSWMIEHRDGFARLARFILEAQAAVADGRIDDAESFEHQAAAVVRELAARLDSR